MLFTTLELPGSLSRAQKFDVYGAVQAKLFPSNLIPFSNAAEIDRVMKKVDEGTELFDEIYEKVYSAEQQSQKEKWEAELKKEIKKLQRLRDQIKSWISGNEVKDKDRLMEYRRLIETKMEAFKVVEKETKTKTYSKEGLAKKEKLDPEEQKREDTTKWISDIIDQLQALIEEKDLEIETLSSGKGKKTNKNKIEDCNQHLTSHRFHLSKLEGILRLVRNERIAPETVDEVKEDLEYYIESHEDDDYQMAYDEECFYEALGLDEMDVVNVDRVTESSNLSSGKKKKDDDATSASSGSKKEKHSKKSNSSTSMIPLTIGRARTKKSKSDDKSDSDKGTSSNEATPTKASRSTSLSSGPAPVVPAPAKTPTQAPGQSMAAMLKRESEERQKAAALAAQQQAQEQARQAELARQQKALAEAAKRQQQQQQLLEHQQAQQKAAAAQAEALRQQQAQADALRKQQQEAEALQRQAQTQQQLAGLSLSNSAIGSNTSMPSGQPMVNAQIGEVSTDQYLSALNDSMLQMPTSSDSERSKTYTPRNPYPGAPASYPSVPSPIFDNPEIFSKLGTDALFFIFYYSQGTYQQYLAAKELKKQSWRYHKKYMTWFQRHEEPKVTTDEYEQGTYVYFDYETGWCQRLKADFRFEYSFLEDSLS